MTNRTGDWRDLLSAYGLALDPKKVFVGFVAVLASVFVMVIAVEAYAMLDGPAHSVIELSTLRIESKSPLLWHFSEGTGLFMLGQFLPLLNPFAGGNVTHFVISVLLYVALFYVWSGAGGAVSRLAALEYARDELPTLNEARQMVRARRKAYFLAPVMPLLLIVFLSILNALGGLVASVPYLGPILLVFPGWPLLVITTVLIVFLAVLGVLGFGMMMPAVSVEGKDAFESWSTAYGYVLWGLRRFICYTLVIGVIGLIAAVVAWAIGELLIYLIYQTVNLGFVRQMPWLIYEAGRVEFGPAAGAWRIGLLPGPDPYMGVFSGILLALLLLVRAVPVGYVLGYFFTANTIVYLLMRKDQDGIEVDEVCEAAEETELGVPPAPPEPEPAPEEPEPEEEPEQEEGPEQEEDEEQEEQTEQEQEQEREPEEGEQEEEEKE